MERTGALIDRLLEQYQQKAGADKMLATVQLLAAELQQEKSVLLQTGRKVSVIMPASFKREAAVEETVDVVKAPAPAAELKPQVKEPTVPVFVAPEIIKPRLQPLAAPVRDIPLPRHEAGAHELNEVIGGRHESLNEKLRTSEVELGTMLQSSPVRDLKKAIGINDRYVFVNELFRGDEVMYERSIKTINTFSILAEAEFWIKRELKLKLAWNDENEAVKHFDQLVRRRFS